MKRLIKSIFSVLVIIGLTIGFTGIPAYASILSPHAYAEQHNSATNLGAYFYNASGQADLYGGYAENNNQGFITDEMWNVFSNESYWIESGDMDGVINGNYWAGHYAAKNDASGYTEYTIGSEFSGSGNSYETKLTSTNTWSVYVNGTLQLQFWEPYSQFDYTEVGIETNNNNSSFTNGIISRGLQTKDLSGTWYNWSSSNVTNRDSYSFGWISSFSSSSDQITFTN